MWRLCEDLTNWEFLAQNWSFDKCARDSPSIVTFYYDRNLHSAIYVRSHFLWGHTWTYQPPVSRHPTAHSLLSVQTLAEIHPAKWRLKIQHKFMNMFIVAAAWRIYKKRYRHIYCGKIVFAYSRNRVDLEIVVWPLEICFMVVVDHLEIQRDVGVVDSTAALFIEALIKVALVRRMLEVFLCLLQLFLQSLDLKVEFINLTYQTSK